VPGKKPDLSRKLTHTVKPTAGPAAQFDSLADAAQLVAADIAEATRCVEVAL